MNDDERLIGKAPAIFANSARGPCQSEKSFTPTPLKRTVEGCHHYDNTLRGNIPVSADDKTWLQHYKNVIKTQAVKGISNQQKKGLLLTNHNFLPICVKVLLTYI